MNTLEREIVHTDQVLEHACAELVAVTATNTKLNMFLGKSKGIISRLNDELEQGNRKIRQLEANEAAGVKHLAQANQRIQQLEAKDRIYNAIAVDADIANKRRFAAEEMLYKHNLNKVL